LSVALVGVLLAPVPAFSGSTTPHRILHDFNGDGMSDVGLVNETGGGNDGLLRNLMMNGVTLDSAAFPTLLPTDIEASGCGNFNGDAGTQTEILTRKVADPNTGLVRIYTLNGTGTATTKSDFIASVPANMQLLGVGNLDNSGPDDLAYWNSSTGLVRVFLLGDDGGGNIIVSNTCFPATIPQSPQPFNGLGVGDADGDGFDDLWAIQDASGSNPGLVRIFLLESDGGGCVQVKNSTFPVQVDLTKFATRGIAPNNPDDDRADLVLQNTSTGLVRIERISANAAGVQGTVFPIPQDPSLTVTGVGDYDGLNQNDVSTRNLGSGLLRTFLLDAAGDNVSTSGFPANPSTNLTVYNNEPVLP